MSNDSGLNVAGDYKINDMSLILSNGTSIDVRNIMVELSIYEDIFSPTLSGSIVINDGHDIFSAFGIHGSEYLRVSIDKPGLQLPYERLFRVYKTTLRSPNTQNDVGQIYVLQFCSEELILSLGTLISKSYKNTQYSNMILDICQNYLKIPSFDPSLIEQTIGNYSLIIPNLRPFEAINFIGSRSFSGTSKYCYFFFETRDGYEFTSIQTMTQRPVYSEYSLENKRIDPDPSNDTSGINELRILSDFDVVTSLSNGGFSSKLATIDIIKQKYDFNTYSQLTQLSNGLLMNKYPTMGNLKDRNGNTIFDNYDSYFRMVTTFTEDINKFMMNRTMHMALLNNFRLSMSIPGDVLFKAGMMISAKYPYFEYSGTGNKKFDKYRTGKFLVTAVRHIFSQKQYYTVAELAQDSFNDQLPGDNSPPTLQTLRK